MRRELERRLAPIVATLCVLAVLVGAGASPAGAAAPTGWSWGLNARLTLGDPAVPSQYVTAPTQVGTGTTWQSIAAADPGGFGIGYSFALRADGTLWAWGSNDEGAFGPDLTEVESTPVQFGTGSDWARLATEHTSGGIHTLAVKTDGTLWAWGINGTGQLGNGVADDTTRTSVPQQVGTDADWSQVAVGEADSAAIKTDGTLWMWGANHDGELGDGTQSPHYAPVQVGVGSHWTAVATGAFDTYAIRDDGTLWAWGSNAIGQLGDGSTTPRLAPSQVGSATDWVKIATPYGVDTPYSGFAVGLRADGTLWAWGGNASGQLGDGTTTSHSTPRRIGSSSDWAKVSASDSYVLATRTDGSLWEWGSSPFPQTGSLRPARFGSGSGYTEVAAAPSHALALKSDGSLWVWGSNWLINDDPPQETLLLPQYRTSPAPIALGDWTQLASAPEHALGIRSDGSLWGWGNNYAGQVGDGTEIYRSAPQPIDANTDWRSVMANISMSFAIRTDGTLWAWGDDFDGVLGLGTGGGVHLSPEQVGTASNWKAVAPGKNHTIGVQDDGTLWAWGDNTWGQLGIPGAFYPNGPLQVGTDNNWAAVAATDNSSFALKTDGTLWAWGDNTLGHPHFSFAPSPGETVDAPQQVGTATNWATINANDDHIFGVRTDGTLWSWGDNTDGVLGTGAAGGVVAAPAQVGADNDWKLAAAGWTHGVAIKTDGSLWAWGDNTTGQLGDGTTTSVLTPERIGTQTSWSGVTAGLGYSFALTSGPAGAPGAPGAPTVVLGDRSADVQWQPADGNGSGISSYTITASPGGATATVDAAQLHAVMSNLTPGTVYTFTVRAANAVGESGESPASAPVTALGRPDPPMDVVATSGERQATVSWTAPADNNSPITGYTVTASPGGETAAVPGDAFSAVVAGLISGTSYTFTVVATNAIGPSSASAPSDPVTPTGAAGPQTISWLKQPPSSVTFGQSFPVAASASTGLPVTITTSGPCSYGAGIVTAVALGLCTVSADQEGNGNWLPAQLTASVTSALVSVTSSAKPGVPGQALTFTATAASTTTPTASLTGAMHLYDGTVLLGTRLVTAGVAKLTTTKLGVGSHSISAVFVARRVSPPVASPQTLVEIVPADTTIQLASSLNPSMFGRTIRFRAKILRVAPARGRITLGMVSFYDGNVLLGSVPIGRGATALVATSTLVRGTHQITAVFSGSPSDRPSSTAIALTQQIR